MPLIDNYPVCKKIYDTDFETCKTMVPDGIHPGGEASVAIAWPTVRTLQERSPAMVK